MSAVLLLGVDTGQQKNGLAMRLPGQPVSVSSFKGIEQLGGLVVLQQAAEIPGIRLVAALECPTWDGYGTREVRSAAVAWERVLYYLFPRRCVFRVDPNEWQRLLLTGVPGATTKDRSLWWARQFGVEVANDHEADAVCLLEMARLREEGLWLPAKQRTAGPSRGKKARK